MMYNGAKSTTPLSDPDSPVVSGSGESHMERGDRQSRHGDVDDEGSKRGDSGPTHILSGSSAQHIITVSGSL